MSTTGSRQHRCNRPRLIRGARTASFVVRAYEANTPEPAEFVVSIGERRVTMRKRGTRTTQTITWDTIWLWANKVAVGMPLAPPKGAKNGLADRGGIA